MKKQMRGMGFYLILIAIVSLVGYYIFFSGKSDSSYTYQNFLEDLKSGNIDEVVITPNKEVPTGKMKFEIKDTGKTKVLYVASIDTVTKTLVENEQP